MTVESPHKVLLESGARVNRCTLEGPLGLGAHTVVSNSRLGSYLGVGCFSFISWASCGRYVSIGSRVSVGGLNHPTTWLSTHRFQYDDTLESLGEVYPDRSILPDKHHERVRIGNDVWIGDNAVILSSVEIPDGCIVGAGSVLSRSISEPFSIVMGNPARTIKKRFDDKMSEKIIQTRWWEMPIDNLPRGLAFNDPLACVELLKER